MNHKTFFLFFIKLVGFLFFTHQFVMAREVDLINTANLQEIWFEEDQFTNDADLTVSMQKEIFSREKDLDNIFRAKFNFINGDLRMAKFYLNRIDNNNKKVVVIKKRYLALIAFVEDKFEQSLHYLDDNFFNESSIYPQICLLKLINFMAVNDLSSLQNEKKLCMSSTAKTSRNDQFWLDTMIKLKLKDITGIKKNLLTDLEYTLSNDEMSRLWTKTGLYLNKEKDFLSLISALPENSYQSKRLREIIAFMYLRSGDAKNISKAIDFVSDIDSANAENIKGNINLQKKEYELAFGHFALALKKKQNSTNSLERAIPLAWILGQWQDGLAMLINHENKKIDPRNIEALRIAFRIRDKQLEEAKKELTILKSNFKNEPPLEVRLMDNYISLLTSSDDAKFDKRKLEDSTEKACRSFDGISCWLSLQFSTWESLEKTIKRDEEIFIDKEMTIESLKEKKAVIPLKETITVNQQDIEELDDANIDFLNKH